MLIGFCFWPWGLVASLGTGLNLWGFASSPVLKAPGPGLCLLFVGFLFGILYVKVVGGEFFKKLKS